MNRVVITLTIDLPEGVVPQVDYGTTPEEPAELVQMAAQIFETLPTQKPEPTFAPFTAVENPQPPRCSHNLPMKRWPAGVNKQGKPYNASWRPDHRDCTDKAIWDRDAA